MNHKKQAAEALRAAAEQQFEALDKKIRAGKGTKEDLELFGKLASKLDRKPAKRK